MARVPGTDVFRQQAHEMVDWIADYIEGGVRDYPVLSQNRPGDVFASLPQQMPETGEDPGEIWKDFHSIIMPGITHWNHPGFMAYFGISSSGPAILGEMLSAALNVNGMLWRTCPSATELEFLVLKWMRQALGLPDSFFGFLCDTASISSFLALAAARDQAVPDVRQHGMSGRPDLPHLRVYASDQAHSSVAKACLALGLGLDGFCSIPHDSEYRMDVEQLQKAIQEDREAGARPMAVVATVGTTTTTSVDPVPEILKICRKEKLWLHVDAAYAGSAAMTPEFRWCLDGCEGADSFVFNPHKWLFVPIDASAFYTRHQDLLRRSFSLVPEYLRTPMEGQVIDLMDYGVQLGRRFRALKLWWTLRSFGLEGIRKVHRGQIAMAQEFARWVDSQPHLERTAPTPFSVVCFRARPEGLADEALDRYNLDLMERLNASGDVYLSHSRLDVGLTLRLAIGNIGTNEGDLARCRERILEEL